MGCPTNKLSAERGGERERREEHANLVLSIVIILVGVWEPQFDGGREVISSNRRHFLLVNRMDLGNNFRRSITRSGIGKKVCEKYSFFSFLWKQSIKIVKLGRICERLMKNIYFRHTIWQYFYASSFQLSLLLYREVCKRLNWERKMRKELLLSPKDIILIGKFYWKLLALLYPPTINKI